MTDYLSGVVERIRVRCGGGDIVLYRIYAVLALAKAPHVSNEDVHDAWVAWQLGIDPAHRSIKPFHELAPDVQDMDASYAAAINAEGSEHYDTR